MTIDGRRFLTLSGLTIAVLGAVTSALVVWFFAGLTFFGEPLHRVDYLHMVLGFALAALLLLLALPPLWQVGRARWLVALAGLLALGCGAMALAAGSEIGTAARGASGEPWWWAPQFFLLLPTTWPVLALITVTPWVRGRSSRSRRAPQDPSAAPGRPRSS